MADPIHLKVLTEAGVAIEESAVSIVAPGELGYLGILKNHAPLVATMGPGKVTFRDPSGGTQVMQSLGAGLLEVQKNQAVLLLDDVREGAA